MNLDKRGKIKLSEKDIQRQVIELLRAHGWIVRPAPRDGRKAIRGAFSVPAGEPDLICLKHISSFGFAVLLIECKSANGKLLESQKRWAYEHDALVHIVRSVDDVKGLL